MKNQPNTWNELLPIGYVIELDKCQIAEAKEKLNPTPFKDFYSEQELKIRAFIMNENEKRLRGE